MDSRKTRVIKLPGLPEVTRRANGSARVIDATVTPMPRTTRTSIPNPANQDYYNNHHFYMPPPQQPQHQSYQPNSASQSRQSPRTIHGSPKAFQTHITQHQPSQTHQSHQSIQTNQSSMNTDSLNLENLIKRFDRLEDRMELITDRLDFFCKIYLDQTNNSISPSRCSCETNRSSISRRSTSTQPPPIIDPNVSMDTREYMARNHLI